MFIVPRPLMLISEWPLEIEELKRSHKMVLMS